MVKRFCAVFSIFALCLFIAGSAFAENLKIGYVNMRKVFFEYKKTKDSNRILEKEDETIKNEIEKKSQEIKKMRDETELLSDKAKEKKEPELREKLRELEEFRRTKVEEFIRKKDELFKEIRDDIINVSSAYAKKNGYDIIFDEAVFVYGSEKYDVTDPILQELNK